MWPGGTQPMFLSQYDWCSCQILGVRFKVYRMYHLWHYRFAHPQEEMWSCGPSFGGGGGGGAKATTIIGVGCVYTEEWTSLGYVLHGGREDTQTIDMT